MTIGLIAAVAIGLFIRWGNRRQLRGLTRPENSRTFGAVLLIALGVGMCVWMKSTGQI